MIKVKVIPTPTAPHGEEVGTNSAVHLIGDEMSTTPSHNRKAVSLSDGIFADLRTPNSKVAAACKFDASQVSRLCSNGMGITLDKLDAAAQAIGFVPVQKEYLHSIQYLCQVGSACECAINGMGACGGFGGFGGASNKGGCQ